MANLVLLRREYETDVQLGATDPSHIIRTIEYWDIESVFERNNISRGKLIFKKLRNKM